MLLKDICKFFGLSTDPCNVSRVKRKREREKKKAKTVCKDIAILTVTRKNRHDTRRDETINHKCEKEVPTHTKKYASL